MTIFRNADDGHMNVGQKRLPFFLRHRERHRRPSRSVSFSGYIVARLDCSRRIGSSPVDLGGPSFWTSNHQRSP
jgi:hypothetical protein